MTIFIRMYFKAIDQAVSALWNRRGREEDGAVTVDVFHTGDG